jgi:phosphotransferase system HPr (HPr) family protein
MRTAETTVRNPTGIHLRPAAMFVRTAAGYKAAITVENLDKPGEPADAKSMIKVTSLQIRQGHRIRIAADGIDEEAAVEGMVAFVDGGCGEQLER